MAYKLPKTISFLLAVTMMMPFTACSSSQNVPSDPFSSVTLTEDVRSWSNQEDRYSELRETFGTNRCNGAMVVATDDDIVYLYCEDAAEKDGTTPVSQDTVFDMASVSKTFTAVCVLQLAEKGKLSIDDTLDKYFPEYETGKNITLYELLHMSSGIPDYCNDPDPFWNISGADAANQKLSDIYLDKITDEEFLQAMYKAPLNFEPGTKSEYSNTNYHLLAFIIEKVSGMKYCDYVKKNIFDICGMTKTSSMAVGDMTYAAVDYDELVQYGFTDNEGYPACLNNCRGDGGIHSCLTDMVAFDRALFTGKLLSKASMEILLKDDKGYCCGLMKEKDGYSHDGSSFTCSTDNRIIESEEFGHIYMITLERNIPLTENDDEETDTDPMNGTKFTKGAVNDGIYTNEYAELKMQVPDGFIVISDSELKEMYTEGLRQKTDLKEKKRYIATEYDSAFWEDGDSIYISFLNNRLGIPDDPDYTEEDCLNDELKAFEGFTVTKKDITKVTLCGKEYTRAELALDFDGMESHLYVYARKLDDDLMLMIEASSIGDRKADFFEELFLGQ